MKAPVYAVDETGYLITFDTHSDWLVLSIELVARMARHYAVLLLILGD